MTESIPLEKNGLTSRYCCFFKMKVTLASTAVTIDQTLKTSIKNRQSFSDKSTSYVNILDFVEIHIS